MYVCRLCMAAGVDGAYVYAAGTLTQEFHITQNLDTPGTLAWAPK